MKKYISAKADIYKLNTGDIMNVSLGVGEFDMDNDESFKNDKGYNTNGAWGNWNS